MNGLTVNSNSSTVVNVGTTFSSGAAVFNGTTAYVRKHYTDSTLGRYVSAGDKFAVYFKVAAGAIPSQATVFSGFTPDTFGYQVYFNTSGNLILRYTKGPGPANNVSWTTTGMYNDGSFYEVLMSFNGTDYDFYVGSESTSGTFTRTDLDVNIAFGAKYVGSEVSETITEYTACSIKDAKVWQIDRNLSTATNESSIVFKLSHQGDYFYDAARNFATEFDFGKVQTDVQSDAIEIRLANETDAATTVKLTMPTGFKARVKSTGSYVSEIDKSIAAFDEETFEVVANISETGTIREIMVLYYGDYSREYSLLAESEMSEYMTIKVEDRGIEVGRLEKDVLVMHREKIINTETDRSMLNETPTTTTRIISPPSGTNALLIYSKYSADDEYWRLRVGDIATTALVNQGDTSHFTLASSTMSEGSRLWIKDGIPTDFDFFDRTTSPYIEENTDYTYRGIAVADNDYLKIDSALDVSGSSYYPMVLHSMDTPHLAAYIPLVFADRVLVEVDKTDKEFEVICLKEV